MEPADDTAELHRPMWPRASVSELRRARSDAPPRRMWGGGAGRSRSTGRVARGSVCGGASRPQCNPRSAIMLSNIIEIGVVVLDLREVYLSVMYAQQRVLSGVNTVHRAHSCVTD